MPFSHTATRKIGRTDLEVPLLGFGCVQIGGWPNALSESDAQKTLQAGWDAGVRMFDVAPMYGIGMSEERLGVFLRSKPRDEFVLSTKVGRLIEDDPSAADVPESEQFFKGAPARRWYFDFSYDGVMRSVEDSQKRLGIDRIDILLIHDPDNHYEQAIDGAYKALDRLRSDGSIKAVGAGMNQNPILSRFARDGVMDCFLLAGRYTLLDHRAIDELFPVCEDHGTTMLIGGVYNSGALTRPSRQATFDYVAMDDDWRTGAMALGVRHPKDYETGDYWYNKVLRIKAVCDRHAVPMAAAALQFAAAHPITSSIVVGAGKPERMQQCADYLAMPIPDDLWAELRAEELLAPNVPVPASR